MSQRKPLAPTPSKDETAIIDMTENQLRNFFADRPIEQLHMLIERLSKLAKSSKEYLSDIDTYLNEEPRRTLVRIGRERMIYSSLSLMS